MFQTPAPPLRRASVHSGLTDLRCARRLTVGVPQVCDLYRVGVTAGGVSRRPVEPSDWSVAYKEGGLDSAIGRSGCQLNANNAAFMDRSYNCFIPGKAVK